MSATTTPLTREDTALVRYLLRPLAAEIWAIGAIMAVVAAVLPWWYRNHALIWGVDTVFPLKIGRASTYFHIPDTGLAAPDVRKLPFVLPVIALIWGWKAVGLPYDVTVLQPVLVGSLLVVSGLSVYALVRLLFGRVERLAALGAALFYMFNLYSLTAIWQWMSNLIFHYSLLPLVLLCWLVALRRRSVVLGIGAALVWSLTLTPVYITTPVALTDVLLFAAVVLCETLGAREGSERRRVLGTASATIGVWVVVNLYWMVPLLVYSHVETFRGLQGGSPAELFRLNSVPLDKGLRLGGFWSVDSSYLGSSYDSWRSYYLDVGLGAAFALPVLAAAGVAGRALRLWRRPIARQDRRYVLLFSSILLVSLLAMTGPRFPLGSAKLWLFREAGLLDAFRSIYQRFGGYAALAYAPLVALGLSSAARAVSGRLRGRGAAALATVAMIPMIVAVSVLPALPLWTGSTFDSSGIIPARRIDLPASYTGVARSVDGQPGDFALLTFPFGKEGAQIPLEWEGGQAGYVGVEPFSLLSDKPHISGDPTTPWVTRLVRTVAGGGPLALRALQLLDVRYVIVHLDVDKPYLQGIDKWVGTDVAHLVAVLDKTRGLSLVGSPGQLAVYRVEPWRAFRVFAVRGYDGRSIYGLDPGAIRPVAYRGSPYRLVVQAGQIRRGDVLVVNHPFDSLWRAGGRSPMKVAPGLTGFRVERPGPVLVEHALDRRFPLLLALIPLGFGLAAGAAALATWRRRAR